MERYIHIDTLIDYIDWDNDLQKWTLRGEPEDIPAADVVKPVKCKNCHYYIPYEKPVEDFDGRCDARGCETDEEEYCSYSTNGNLKTNF